MLVSHDFRLISQVAEEIWVCDKQVSCRPLHASSPPQTITKWEGDILAYKRSLISKLED